MKTALLILLVSLAGNIALLAVLVRTPPGAPAPLQSSSTVSIGDAPPPSPAVESIHASAPLAAHGPRTAAGQPLWPEVFSDDPRVFAQQLAAAGFPPSVVHNIIEEQVGRHFRNERRKLRPDDTTLPYWQAPRRAPGGRELIQRMRELSVAQQRALREALGPERILADETRLAWMRREYGVSDPQKLVQLSTILDDYQEVGSEASEGGGDQNPDLRDETQRLIQQERLADIAALLTPEEFAAYEMRAGPVGRTLRYSLRDFQPTEAEYRSLFSAYRAGEDTGRSGNVNSERLLERARTVLPPDRYAELQQAVTPASSGINRIARRLNLPLTAVAPAHAAHRELRERANAVRRDRSLTPEQRSNQLAAIGEEATQRIKAVLGERGFAAYRERDGNWIGALNSPPPPGPQP